MERTVQAVSMVRTRRHSYKMTLYVVEKIHSQFLLVLVLLQHCSYLDKARTLLEKTQPFVGRRLLALERLDRDDRSTRGRL